MRLQNQEIEEAPVYKDLVIIDQHRRLVPGVTLSELLLLVHQVWMDTTLSHTITNIINIGAMKANNLSEVTDSLLLPRCCRAKSAAGRPALFPQVPQCLYFHSCSVKNKLFSGLWSLKC